MFRITPGGSLTTLYAFPPGGLGDFQPASLVRGADGNLYGTTAYGEPSVTNEIFRLSLQGAVTGVAQVRDALGRNPSSRPRARERRALLRHDRRWRHRLLGTAFAMDLAGTATTLYRFTGSVKGAQPGAPLVQASDGNFYGTTSFGGLYNFGTVFRATPSGGFATVYTFSRERSTGGRPDTALGPGSGWSPGTHHAEPGRVQRRDHVPPWALDGTFRVFPRSTPLLMEDAPEGDARRRRHLHGTTRTVARNSNRGTVYRATPDGRVTVCSRIHRRPTGAGSARP